jgi:hypothetical protein
VATARRSSYEQELLACLTSRFGVDRAEALRQVVVLIMEDSALDAQSRALKLRYVWFTILDLGLNDMPDQILDAIFE